MGATGLLGLARWAFERKGAAMAKESEPYRGLKVGVHSYSLRKFNFADTVRITNGFGVHYIGLNPLHLPLESPPEKLTEAKAYIERSGLTLLGCGVIGFDTDEKKARQVFEYAKAMGMRTIAANPTPESLDILDKLVSEFGIRIAIHNHGPESEYYKLPEDVLKAIRGHHELIGACVDFGHFERAGVKAEDALRDLTNRLYDVHLKDVNRADAKGHTVVLGQGIVNLPAILDDLVKMRFDGHVALEYESDPENPVPAMDKCFAYVRKVLAA